MTNMVVVSSDSHVGPRLEEDLRPYCPAKHLERFDAYTAEIRAAQSAPPSPDAFDVHKEDSGKLTNEAMWRRYALNLRTAGHHDPAARIRDMDADGTAAEVIFHGSANGQPFPFMPSVEFFSLYRDLGDLELLQVGYRMYNRWLADFVSHAPERLLGLIYVPMWDVDLAVREVEEFGAVPGFRGVNLPAPRGELREYDDPVWEPFWAACERFGLALTTHGGLPPNPVRGPHTLAMLRIEAAGWPARRAMHRLIFAGVFERHPGLNLVFTEQTRGWWTYAVKDLDWAYGTPTKALRDQVPRKPSEYMKEHVYIGASFMPPDEVDEALAEGYWPNVVWGRDYPHGEGTYKFPESDDEPNMTKTCLRWAFAGRPSHEVRAMVGDNGIRAYRLDRDALTGIAAEIGPAEDELGGRVDGFPDGWDDILTR
jgi:predicted TIM-barrel fold metal-dependent hydrolase